MRNPPAMTGRAADHRVCHQEACSTRSRSRHSSGMLLRPTTVFTSMGKKTMRAQMSTLENRPGPNQMMRRGAMATTGMAWLATR